MKFKITALCVISCVAYAIANHPTNLAPRVIGNYPPNPSVYGFIVSVKIDNRHACGGAIFGKRFIVTSATCLRDVQPNHLTIFAGETRLSETNSASARVFKIDRIFKKTEAFTDTKDNIALLRTTEEMPIESPYISSAKFPNQDVPIGVSAYMCGWGANEANGPNTVDALNCAQGKTISLAECGRSGLDNSNICAKTNSAIHGPCEMDQGGPLFTSSGTEFIGIATPMLSCGRDETDVYMRAAAYQEWIVETVKANSARSINSNHFFLLILFIIPIVF